jgi:hypothetical protein
MPTSNQSVYTPSCILNQQYAAAWECLDEEPVPFWIEYKGQKPFIKLGQPGPGRTAFTYGAQLPNLNDSYFPLVPSIDKDDPNAGGAMFVALLYNKLTVGKMTHCVSIEPADSVYSTLERVQWLKEIIRSFKSRKTGNGTCASVKDG